MSFFRNLRSSITRGRSSSRDTTPVRNSRPGSVISIYNSGNGKRRDSIESRSESLLNRSETFIVDDPDESQSHSNSSTLEKKSKKSKVLEKFSTFTKRKKAPPAIDSLTFEHHPSDNATNTYYKWQADGGNSLDYDSQNDPFNFLYDQQSSLKSIQNVGHSSPHGDSLKSASPSSNTFDSSTYRKGKMPSDFRKQSKMLKDYESINKENDYNRVKDVQEEKPVEEKEIHTKSPLSEADKYRTVTLNSFRKSFREKFLQQQKEAPYNPSWFVEVEPSDVAKNKKDERDCSKENKQDLLVFENENYRPGSRSPIRDLSNRKPIRSPARSPVKRTDTFKVERPSRLDKYERSKLEDDTPSIRIEFKNSITPHVPGRLVPVGVAKPMPSSITTSLYYPKNEPLSKSTYSMKSAGITTTRLNNYSPIRNAAWTKSQTPPRALNTSTSNVGRYQTSVQIKNDRIQPVSPIPMRNTKQSTRIQLNSSTDIERKSNISPLSPASGKCYNSSYLASSGSSKAQPLRQTYFGDSPQTTRVTHTDSPLSASRSSLRTRTTGPPAYGSTYKYHTPTTSSLLFATTTATLTPSSRTTPSHSALNINSSTGSNNLYPLKYQKYQQQPRTVVVAQRRPRSPIKLPWR